MTKNKSIILIPFWVQEILNRNRMELSECLDFQKLKSVMSLSDLVSFATLQHYMGFLTGMEDASSPLSFVWMQNIPNDRQDIADYLTKTVTGLENDPSFRKNTEARLFNPDVRTNRYEVPFITYDLTPEVAGVVIYPGFFTGQSGVANLPTHVLMQNTALQLELVEAMLKVLYVYETHSAVASTPLFKRYLELLSQKQIIV